jgi:hypothetical protein
MSNVQKYSAFINDSELWAGVAQSVEQLPTEWTTEGSQFEYRRIEFSLLQIVQTVSGAHPASYLMGIGGSFPGNKR